MLTRKTSFFLSVAIASALFAGACSSSDADSPPTGSDEGGGGGGGPDGGPSVDEDGNVIVRDGATEDATQKEASAPKTGNSCVGLAANCGGSKDCCASNAVMGGTFNRGNDATYPATISDFKLDVYEVTVGRVRTFVNAGAGTQASPPAAGDGLHPKIPGSGWDPAWNAKLEANTVALRAALSCPVAAAYPAWSNTPGANETKPINCMTWYEAFAFCAWDGGRLPTEAEWNYAAAGGSEQRDYPWGATIDHSKASYDCHGAGAGACTFADLLAVGSKSPAGDGKWGQADLAGNVWEWTLDWAATPYRLKPCNDCADLQASPTKTFRGGGLANESFLQLTSVRIDDVATDRDYDVGLRCAR